MFVPSAEGVRECSSTRQSGSALPTEPTVAGSNPAIPANVVIKEMRMTYEERKGLLIKELCSRLPYNSLKVKRPDDGSPDYVSAIDIDAGTLSCLCNGYTDDIEKFVPYLRSMSSMTEEERKEYLHITLCDVIDCEAWNEVDWLNKKMFAYRTIDGKDMFELGLALEAPKGMYDSEKD